MSQSGRDLAHISNAERARILARICASLVDRLGGEIRIPKADLKRGGSIGFAWEGDDLLIALGDREPAREGS